MVLKRGLGSMGAAFVLFFAFPALASAHILAVTVSPSQCIVPLNGSYTATVTVTESYFGATTEDIPVGQNVRELPSSTDRFNFGLNQNYFTTGAVGIQAGPADLGQPTSFTSPREGRSATQQFTVTTSVPETYVLANSYMRAPAVGTITAPQGGCTPPPVVSVTATTQCTAPLSGSYSATIDVTSSEAFDVPAGASSAIAGSNFFSPAVTGAPSSFAAPETKFTVTNLSTTTVYVIGAPGGNVATVTLTAPTGGCLPPTVSVTASTQCTQPLDGSYSAIVDVHSSAAFEVTPGARGGAAGTNYLTSNASGEPDHFQAGDTAFTVSGLRQPTVYVIGAPGGDVATVALTAPAGGCQPPPPPPCIAPELGSPVKAGRTYTVVVWLRRGGKPAPAARLRVTVPGVPAMIKTAGRNGKITFVIKAKRTGVMYLQSTTCAVTGAVKITPVKPKAPHRPSFTA
jgi:hypothetical protein